MSSRSGLATECSSDLHSVASFAAFLKTMADGINNEELSGMKAGALNKRAREVGLSADAMDDAADEDDPRAALIALIVAASPAELLSPGVNGTHVDSGTLGLDTNTKQSTSVKALLTAAAAFDPMPLLALASASAFGGSKMKKRRKNEDPPKSKEKMYRSGRARIASQKRLEHQVGDVASGSLIC